MQGREPTGDRGVVIETHTTSALSLREKRRLDLISAVEQVAMNEFIRDGYENVSIGAICEKAGISTSTFFRHFTNKEAIVGDIIRDIERRVAVRLSAVDETEGLVDPYLGALRSEFAELGYSDPAYLVAIASVVTSPGVRGLFMSDLSGVPHDMDRQIALRLKLPIESPIVRTVRALQWVAVDQAMAQQRETDSLDNLIERARDFLGLVSRAESSGVLH